MTTLPQFDMQPTLVGKTIGLRPMQADDFEALYAAGIDPLTWEQTPYPMRYQRPLLRVEPGTKGSSHRLYISDGLCVLPD